MNIFKILSRGHGKINETNVTSFLGFMIDPYAEHGMGKLFLSEFLKKINTNGKLKGLYTNGELSKELLNKYNIQVELETQLENKTVELATQLEDKTKDKKGKKSRIDIYIEFNAISPAAESYVMGIEVKINESAVRKDQLIKYAGNLTEIKNTNTRIFKECHLVYLTLDTVSEAVVKEYDSVEIKVGLMKKHIAWDDITEILEKIINADNQAKIDPLHYNTKLTIQAFNQFIESGFADDKDGKSMKYKVIINKDEIFENTAGQMVRQICKYLIENDKLKINHLTNEIKVKTKKEIPLIINQTEFEKYKSEVEEKITDGKIKTTKIRRYHKPEEIIHFGNEKYYVTTELTEETLIKFAKYLNENEISVEFENLQNTI
jgi:hypothetical protein